MRVYIYTVQEIILKKYKNIYIVACLKQKFKLILVTLMVTRDYFVNNHIRTKDKFNLLYT